jgi:hypothetical protein
MAIYETALLPLASLDLPGSPAHDFIGLDRIGNALALALFLRSLWASLKRIGTRNEYCVHRNCLS